MVVIIPLICSAADRGGGGGGATGAVCPGPPNSARLTSIRSGLSVTFKSGGTVVSRQRLRKMQSWPWVTVMTGVSPSFRVGVSFEASSLCLILNRVLVAD